jgi:hypothetical protein
MAHDTKIILSNPLPTPEQLESYLILRGCLQERPETVSDEDKKAFCLLILSSCPAVMDTADLVLVQKLCPEEWRHYLRVGMGQAGRTAGTKRGSTIGTRLGTPPRWRDVLSLPVTPDVQSHG